MAAKQFDVRDLKAPLVGSAVGQPRPVSKKNPPEEFGG